jgi:hypothetical protein
MTEVRLNDEGKLDEVVGNGAFHLEQMDRDHWWMYLDGVHVYLTSKDTIKATLVDEREGKPPTDATSR